MKITENVFYDNKKKLTDSKKYPSLIALYEISFILLRLIQSYYGFANYDG